MPLVTINCGRAKKKKRNYACGNNFYRSQQHRSVTLGPRKACHNTYDKVINSCGGVDIIFGALGRLVGHCSTCATSGGWESAQKAQDATDAANDLGVHVTNSQNRKETAKALVAAGRTYFDYYNHKREEAAGNPNCGGKLDLYGASGVSY